MLLFHHFTTYHRHTLNITIGIFIACWLLPILCLGQDARFRVMVDKDILVPGDTLELAALYSVGDRAMPPATFVATLQGPHDEVWQMRWPLTNGEAMGTIVLPDSMNPGVYHLMFAIQPRFFKVFGEVYNPGKAQSIRAQVRTVAEVKTLDFPLDAGGRFIINDLYFENNLFINFLFNDKKQKEFPLVKIDAWLDSAFTPVAYAVKQIIVKEAKDSVAASPALVDKLSYFNNDFSCFEANYAAKLKAKKYQGLKPLALYDSIYLPAFLIPAISQSIDLLSDSVLLAKRSLYHVLQQVMPNAEIDEITMQVSLSNKTGRNFYNPIISEWMVSFEGKFYRIWADGQFNAYEHITQYPDRYATIKVVSPQLFPGIKGDRPFGIIAIFERKYPFGIEFPYNNRYRIRGYTPPLYALPASPLLRIPDFGMLPALRL